MITLVTGNPDKLVELQAIMSDLEVTSQSIDVSEIQSMDLEAIVHAKVRAAYEAVATTPNPSLVSRGTCAVIVEDVSFEIAALGGMPGPFVKWWAKAAGYEPALIVCEKTGNFAAKAVCGAAYCDGGRTVYAEATVSGRLTRKTDGEGFGFDFYFIPDGYDRSFAQLGRDIKNQISHRALCLRKLATLI
jgi:non-canonical purine NTP pyrophosphatase (RdgB/HAM1 family)